MPIAWAYLEGHSCIGVHLKFVTIALIKNMSLTH
jgi:hypothetical protein